MKFKHLLFGYLEDRSRTQKEELIISLKFIEKQFYRGFDVREF